MTTSISFIPIDACNYKCKLMLPVWFLSLWLLFLSHHLFIPSEVTITIILRLREGIFVGLLLNILRQGTTARKSLLAPFSFVKLV